MSNSGLIAAIDIGGTKIAAGAVTDGGEIVAQAESPTAPHAGFASAMERAAVMLRECARAADGEFRGIGVACPSPLDPFTGIIGDVGTLPGWQGGNILAALQHEFGLSVAVENDADSAALAEAAWGQAHSSGRFLYVTVSTGIGAGILIDGKLYRGVDGAHPEIGHHVLDWSGPLCYCGARGCWEVLAAGPAMSAWVREQDPERGHLNAAQICALARTGDDLARRAVEREALYLGLGLANLITLFAPDTIALGGGVMRSADLFMDGIREVIRRIVTQVPAEKTVLTQASLGHGLGLAGAARAWLHRYGG